MKIRVAGQVLYSRDPARTADFYRCLGFVFTVEKHGDGPEHFAAENGGFLLEIYPERKRSGPSLRLARTRLIFETDDIEAARQALSDARARHDGPIPSVRGDVLRAVDPDGREVMILRNDA